jgi:O-antigen polysaccharide polymerase Wzy
MSAANDMSNSAARSSRPLARKIWPLCIHAIPVCISGLLVLFADPPTVFVVGGVVATITYAYLVWLECRSNPILVTPLNCFFFWFGLVLGPTAIYVGIRFSENGALPFLVAFVPLSSVAIGYLVTLVGALFLHLGIVFGLAETASLVLRRADSGSAVTSYTVLICAGISLLYAHYTARLQFVGSTLGYLLIDIGPAAACIYAVSKRSGFREEWMKIFILAPVTVLLAMARGSQGSKLGIVVAFIPLVWFFLMERKRRIILIALCPFVAAAYVLVVTPAVTSARIAVGAENVTMSDILASGVIQMDALARQPQEYVWQWSDEVAQRLFSEPVAVGYIATRVETEGYTYGATLDYMVWASVPRILWKDKPYVSRGGWFTADIGASLTPEAAGTSTGMTSPGELFWNFGWIGVMCGMGLMGLLIALLWRLALPDPTLGIIAMLPYVHILADAMLYQDSEAGSSIMNIIQAYLLFFVVMKVAQMVWSKKIEPKFALQY